MYADRSSPGRAPTVERATDSIRDKILMRQYSSGFVLTEALLAEEYGISRGSVRSALFVLEMEGLIATQPNGRKRVLGINEKYVIDLCDMRGVLECEAAKRCISEPSVDCARLAAAVAGFYIVGDLSPEEVSERRALANTVFHRALVEIAQNRPLLQCWDTIEAAFTAVTKINYLSLGGGISEEELVRSHIHLLEMIIKRDPQAVEVVSKHALSSKGDSIQALKNQGWL